MIYSNFFDDDICWCGDSDNCPRTDCFRHMSNRKHRNQPDIFTLARFQGTPDCVFAKEENKNELQ